MNLNQKIIRPKIGLLELAKSLGNVSSAVRQWGIAEIVIIDSRLVDIFSLIYTI